MTQHCGLAACKHGSHPARAPGEGVATDRENTAMNADQPAGCDSAAYLPAGYA